MNHRKPPGEACDGVHFLTMLALIAVDLGMWTFIFWGIAQLC